MLASQRVSPGPQAVRQPVSLPLMVEATKRKAANGRVPAPQVQIVGHWLRRLRRKNRLKQPELAKRVGIPTSDLARIERDEARASLDVLVRILSECNAGLEDLTRAASGGRQSEATRRRGPRRRQ